MTSIQCPVSPEQEKIILSWRRRTRAWSTLTKKVLLRLARGELEVSGGIIELRQQKEIAELKRQLAEQDEFLAGLGELADDMGKIMEQPAEVASLRERLDAAQCQVIALERQLEKAVEEIARVRHGVEPPEGAGDE